MSFVIEKVADCRCRLAESPVWWQAEQLLLWSDIDSGVLWTVDPNTGRAEKLYEGRPVGGIVAAESGKFLLFRDAGNVVQWDGSVCQPVIDDDPLHEGTRFNDVHVGPDGAVYAGTLTSENAAGKLYRYSKEAPPERLLGRMGTPNGMGFSADQGRFYFTDTRAFRIYVTSVRKPGVVSKQDMENVQTLFQTPGAAAGRPDGMTVAEDGMIWSALYEGGAVVQLDQKGAVMERIDLPTAKITSVAFGGNNLETLFVTSAGGTPDEVESHGSDSNAGAVFAISGCGKGRPEYLASGIA